MKKVAILGKPNVGKSSLFNRLAKERIAITSEFAGTTRDINKKIIHLESSQIQILDTGGIDRTEESELFVSIRRKALAIAQESDLILYLVDGKNPPDDEDRRLFYHLQKSAPCLLVVNKIDNDKEKQLAYAFESFGARICLYISVSHNRGIGYLITQILSTLGLSQIPAHDESLEQWLEQRDDTPQNPSQTDIKVGIIGRVNVGKSSLLNALVKEERSVVSQIAGTTIDPVDSTLEYKDHSITFVDTAGLRRASKITGIEKYALDRTNKILEKSDIALLVLDASAPLVELDEKISSLVYKHNLGIIIVLNKWDVRIKEYKEMMTELRYKFKFLEFAPVITASALNKRHITEIKDKILEVYQNFCMRIPTNQLNEAISQATKRHPLPSDHGKLVKIYYAVQFDTCPPQISLISNRPKSLHFSYKRYLINFLREHFGFEGTPILIFARDKKSAHPAQEPQIPEKSLKGERKMPNKAIVRA